MTHLHEKFPDTHHDATSNTLFGFWIYLMTDAVMFAALFATYAVLRGNTAGGPSGKELFSLSLAFTETFLLLTSLFTFSLARLAMDKKDLKTMILWLVATFFLGAAFLGWIGAEMSALLAKGYSWQRSGFLSAYFTLVATHALHVFVALLFMIVFAAQSLAWGFSEKVLRRFTCLQMFWSFSYLLWIFMFAIVYLKGAAT